MSKNQIQVHTQATLVTSIDQNVATYKAWKIGSKTMEQKILEWVGNEADTGVKLFLCCHTVKIAEKASITMSQTEHVKVVEFLNSFGDFLEFQMSTEKDSRRAQRVARVAGGAIIDLLSGSKGLKDTLMTCGSDQSFTTLAGKVITTQKLKYANSYIVKFLSPNYHSYNVDGLKMKLTFYGICFQNANFHRAFKQNPGLFEYMFGSALFSVFVFCQANGGDYETMKTHVTSLGVHSQMSNRDTISKEEINKRRIKTIANILVSCRGGKEGNLLMNNKTYVTRATSQLCNTIMIPTLTAEIRKTVIRRLKEQKIDDSQIKFPSDKDTSKSKSDEKTDVPAETEETVEEEEEEEEYEEGEEEGEEEGAKSPDEQFTKPEEIEPVKDDKKTPSKKQKNK